MTPKTDLPDWRYDESIPLGRDFTSADEVRAYDAFHRRFRDPDADAARAMELLAPRPDWSVADYGCGTGVLVLRLAAVCREVHAIDLSPAMLRFAADRAAEQNLSNIRFHHATFLTYSHQGPLLDAAHSALALHHLPDFWKQIALSRIHAALKPGAPFLLSDMSWPDDHPIEAIQAWLAGLAASDPQIAAELSKTPRREFVTSDWILRQILQRAGFTILQAIEAPTRISHSYLCRA